MRHKVMFQAKDFIETAEGLIFAVVSDGTEGGRVLCFLRYVQNAGSWRKVATEEANQLLARDYPQYLYYSPVCDARLHGVPLDVIIRHYQPRIELAQLLRQSPGDAVIQDLFILCQGLKETGTDLNKLGITGSILVGRQNAQSDIDLVCYGRDSFHQTRQSVRQLLEQSRCKLLTENDWQASYLRRDCALSLKDYVWHEVRKFNKALINGRKFDLSLLVDNPILPQRYFHKLGFVKLKVKIIDDTYSFDYPAQWQISHLDIKHIVCFTATYTGQAQTDEWVEVAGLLEEGSDGLRRIVVGSSREATDEYIKVIEV